MTYPTCERNNGTQAGSTKKAAASFPANELWISGAVGLTASVLFWVIIPILRFSVGVAVLLLLIAVVVTVFRKSQVRTVVSFS